VDQPVVQIIQRGEQPYSMFTELKKYPWLLEVTEYVIQSGAGDRVFPASGRYRRGEQGE
jgi:hypothetical protein